MKEECNKSVKKLVDYAFALCDVITDMPCTCDICPLRKDIDDDEASRCELSDCVAELKEDGVI